MKHVGQHAIVIGASMGGLLAARALSDFYAVVTVLERDALPRLDIPRKGVPQGRHPHGLLARGRAVIENFFPGWTSGVVACGGVMGDISGDVSWNGHGVTIKSAPSDLVGLLASRPVLEGNVRRRLMALPNVRVIENCAVRELVADDSKTTIKGVRARVSNGVEHMIAADLVVDASGRSSSSPAWLESFGFAKPEQERIEIGIGYTTRALSPPSDRSQRQARGGDCRQRTELAQWNDPVPDRGSMDCLDRRLFWRSCVRRRPDVRRLCRLAADI